MLQRQRLDVIGFLRLYGFGLRSAPAWQPQIIVQVSPPLWYIRA